MTSLSEEIHYYVVYFPICRVLRWRCCLLKDATFLVCILCRPNLATIGFIGIIVERGDNTPCHHRFELDVSEEIGNPALKTPVSTETMVVGHFIGNTEW